MLSFLSYIWKIEILEKYLNKIVYYVLFQKPDSVTGVVRVSPTNFYGEVSEYNSGN